MAEQEPCCGQGTAKKRLGGCMRGLVASLRIETVPNVHSANGLSFLLLLLLFLLQLVLFSAE